MYVKCYILHVGYICICTCGYLNNIHPEDIIMYMYMLHVTYGIYTKTIEKEKYAQLEYMLSFLLSGFYSTSVCLFLYIICYNHLVHTEKTLYMLVTTEAATNCMYAGF